MKSLKLDHKLAAQVLAGKKTATWRLNDDKDLHVNDDVMLVDKVDQNDPTTWKTIGVARICSVLEKLLGDVSQADMQDGEKFTSIEDLLKTFRGYYGPQVSEDTPVKIIRFSFSPVTEIDHNMKGLSELKHAKLFADGGSRGNPGPSAAGFVLFDGNDKVIVENGLFLGVTTNNQAEYQALKIGLEEALRQGIQTLDVYMDSMLVVNQMKNIFKVKNHDLSAIHGSVQHLASQFRHINFSHVPRELNKVADAMVNQVLDAEAFKH